MCGGDIYVTFISPRSLIMVPGCQLLGVFIAKVKQIQCLAFLYSAAKQL